MNLPDFHQKPHFLRATFHINTPMFIAGANPQEPELTPTGFKGVMRFWWRALNWSRIRINSETKEQALKELHQQEAELFGLASGDNKGGQGECFVNTVKFDSENIRKWSYTGNKSGVSYLLGQGLFHFRDGLSRNAFLDKQFFTVDLTIAPSSNQDIQDCLQIIGLLGGLGSRSRHGFGSITLKKLEKKSLADGEYEEVAFEKDVKKALQDLLSKYKCKENKELPPLSAFYQGTRIDIVRFNDNALDLLNRIGEEQQMYRSFGRNGMVNEKEAERNFSDDHNLMYELAEGENINSHPERVIFGLPHNYYVSGVGVNVDIEPIYISDDGKQKTKFRRASPLIIHVHQNGNTFDLIQCLFKSEYIHSLVKLEMLAYKKEGRKKTTIKKLYKPISVDFSHLENFMNRRLFNNKETI